MSTRPFADQIGNKQTPVLESGYMRETLAVAEMASEMFSSDMWVARCESIRKSFLAIDKPNILKNNTSLSSSVIHLSSIINEVNEIIELLTDFCPRCEKSTKRVMREYQDIQRRLKLIIQKCKVQPL